MIKRVGNWPYQLTFQLVVLHYIIPKPLRCLIFLPFSNCIPQLQVQITWALRKGPTTHGQNHNFLIRSLDDPGLVIVISGVGKYFFPHTFYLQIHQVLRWMSLKSLNKMYYFGNLCSGKNSVLEVLFYERKSPHVFYQQSTLSIPCRLTGRSTTYRFSCHVLQHDIFLIGGNGIEAMH